MRGWQRGGGNDAHNDRVMVRQCEPHPGSEAAAAPPPQALWGQGTGFPDPVRAAGGRSVLQNMQDSHAGRHSSTPLPCRALRQSCSVCLERGRGAHLQLVMEALLHVHLQQECLLQVALPLGVRLLLAGGEHVQLLRGQGRGQGQAAVLVALLPGRRLVVSHHTLQAVVGIILDVLIVLLIVVVLKVRGPVDGTRCCEGRAAGCRGSQAGAKGGAVCTPLLARMSYSTAE